MNQTMKYTRIVNDIRAGIADGTHSPGSQIATDAKLTREYAVSRATVTKAISELVNEGLLYRVQGKGTFVAPRERSSRTGNIGVLVGNIESKFYSMLARQLDEVCRAADYHTIVASTLTSLNREEKLINDLVMSRKVDGFIVCSVNLSCPEEQAFYRSLHERGIPLVVLFPQVNVDGLFTLTMDYARLTRETVQHLADTGCRRIGHVFTQNRHYINIQERIRGYREAMEELQLPVDEDFLFEVPDASEMEGFELGVKLAKLGRLPDGLCTLTDELAFGIIAGMRALGGRVPEDLRLIGTGDLALASADDMRLTTMACPYNEICQTALDLVLQQREDPARPPVVKFFNTRLVIRESCGCHLTESPVGTAD